MRYQHLALLLKKQDVVPVNEQTVRMCAINKVNSIINSLPGERQELEMRKRVLMNTHIRAVNNKVKAVEICKQEVGNNFFAATQGVQAKSSRPEPSSDSDSSDSDLSDSDSDLSDPEAIEDKARCRYKDLGFENKTEFESDIEAALKGCFLAAKKGKKAATKKTVGLKRKNVEQRIEKEELESQPMRKRIRSHA